MDLTKNGATLETQEKIMKLRLAVLSLQEENLALKKRVADLEDELATSTQMNYKKPFYFKEGDDQPFCPICWEKDNDSVHLIGPGDAGLGLAYQCYHCKTSYESKQRAESGKK